MIRPLVHQDCDIIQSVLDRDPFNHVHLIHSLQTYGLKSRYAMLWGAFGGDRLEGVLLVDTLLADHGGPPRFAYLAGDSPQVLAKLGQFALKANVRVLKGKSTYIRRVIEDLPRGVESHLSRWDLIATHPDQLTPHCDYPVEAATRDDIPSLLELYRDWEYSGRSSEKEMELEFQRVIDGSAAFFCRLEGRVVSAGVILAETDRAGLIGYARTLPESRGRGIYSSVQTACIRYLWGKGKTVLAIVQQTNAAMHRVMEKVGTSVHEPWLVAILGPRNPLGRVLLSRLRRWVSRTGGWVSHR